MRRQCRIALAAEVGPVTAILGCQADRCAATIADLSVSTHVNAEWQEGMASSIRLATSAAIEAGAAGLLILHCDQYRVTCQDLQKLQGAWTASNGVTACRSRHGNYLGPPVILPAGAFAGASRLQGDEGARRVLSSLAAGNLIDVDVPTAIHDLDLPSQLLEIRSDGRVAGDPVTMDC